MNGFAEYDHYDAPLGAGQCRHAGCRKRFPDTGAPYIIPKPERPYLGESTREPGPLKIAFTKKSPLDIWAHPECQKAVENAAALLPDLEHRVDEAEPSTSNSPFTEKGRRFLL